MKFPAKYQISDFMLMIIVGVAVLFTPTPTFAKNSIKYEVARRFLLASPDRDVFVAIEKHFPRDARKLVNTFVKAPKYKKPETLGRKFRAIAEQLRKRNARYLLRAPAPALLELTNYHLDSLNVLRRDSVACNAFYMGGPGGLGEKARRKYEKTKPGQDATVAIRTMAAGRDTPTRRGRVKQSDFEEFGFALREAGFADADFERISNPDIKDPKLCKSAIKFMTLVRDIKIDGIHRIRADMFYESLSE